MKTVHERRPPARRLFAFGLSLAISAVTGAQAAGSWAKVLPSQVVDWQERGVVFLFVDTRPQQLFGLKHARGAMNLPSFAFSSKPFPRAAKIVLYDAGAGSSDAEKAAEVLQAKGHPEFYILEGGLTEWEAEGLPIVVQPGPAIAPLVEPLGAEDLYRLIDTGGKVAILDVRAADLYGQSRVPGAMPASTEDLMGQVLSRLNETDLIVLYDDGGGEARDRAEQLRRRGFRAVKYLHGGMLAWREKQLRVER